MKKSIAMLCAALLCGNFLCVMGAEDAADTNAAQSSDDAETLNFMQIRNGALSQERADSIKSARIIYAVRGKGIKDAALMLRARKYDQVRLDAVKGKEHFCSVRNGNDFWNYSQEEGAARMEKEDAQDFAQYVAFLAVPFYKEQIFSDPVFKQKEQLGNTTCYSYEVKANDGSQAVYHMWIEKKSHVLHRMEKDPDGNSPVTLTYRKYKMVGGVKLPGTIYITNPRGSFQMNLVSADWNLDLDDAIFTQSSKPADDAVKKLIEMPAVAALSAESRQKEEQDKNRIRNLEKKIAKLKIEIEAEEKNVNKMESIAEKNRSQETGLASINSNRSSNYSWGWGWSSGGSDHYDVNTRRNLIKTMEKENQKAVNEYRAGSSRLLKKRLQLCDLETELAQLKEDNTEVKVPEEVKAPTDKKMLR